MKSHISNTANPVDFPSESYAVCWIFKNGHNWRQTFASELNMSHWIARVGLLTHPDIVRVTVIDPEGERDLKRVV